MFYYFFTCKNIFLKYTDIDKATLLVSDVGLGSIAMIWW